MSAAEKIDEYLHQIAQIVTKITGVQLGVKQMSMVEARVMKRVRELKLANYQEYLKYFKNHQEKEIDELVSILTTHHTYFFREFSQFEFISKKYLEKLIQEVRQRSDKTIRIWSAACSHGHEVYSLSMFFDYHLKQLAPDVKYKILGTDVDVKSVKIASNGVYTRDEINEIPLHYLENHWARGTGDIENYVKAKKSIREACEFQPLNLNDIPSTFIVENKFDIVFCRNVFIYFTPENIIKIVNKLIKTLNPNGLLFVGYSESLNGLSLPLYSLGPSIYSLNKPVREVRSNALTTHAPSKLPDILRVLCVDDSPSIITLMKKILSKEAGFEVVATASNGIEAAEKLKTTKVDLVTLDIHMPEQTGIEYLEKNYDSNHPPVILVSSVSRDDQELAQKGIRLGAADFVEKPSLNDFAKRAEEIVNKLKAAYLLKSDKKVVETEVDKSFKKKLSIANPESKLHCIVLKSNNLIKASMILKEVMPEVHPPIYVLIDDAHSDSAQVARSLTNYSKFTVSVLSGGKLQSQANSIYVTNDPQVIEHIVTQSKTKSTVFSMIGNVSNEILSRVAKNKLSSSLLLITEEGSSTSKQAEGAKEIVPISSYGYLAIKHFAGRG